MFEYLGCSISIIALLCYLCVQDIVTRYATAVGHHVTRRFGWDCHGLPVEHEIDKKLNVKCRDDVMAMGIDVYNEECRSIVMRYSKEWEIVVQRIGRWIDFENDYKTLDPSFMESVWWVFKQLFEKGLVYRGFKVRVRVQYQFDALFLHALLLA